MNSNMDRMNDVAGGARRGGFAWGQLLLALAMVWIPFMAIYLRFVSTVIRSPSQPAAESASIPAVAIAVRVADEMPPGYVLLTNRVGQYQYTKVHDDGTLYSLSLSSRSKSRAEAIDDAWKFYDFCQRDRLENEWHVEMQGGQP